MTLQGSFLPKGLLTDPIFRMISADLPLITTRLCWPVWPFLSLYLGLPWLSFKKKMLLLYTPAVCWMMVSNRRDIWASPSCRVADAGPLPASRLFGVLWGGDPPFHLTPLVYAPSLGPCHLFKGHLLGEACFV